MQIFRPRTKFHTTGASKQATSEEPARGTHSRRCLFPLFLVLAATAGCGIRTLPTARLTLMEASPLQADALAGDTAPVRDPSIILEDGRYYLFSTDPAHPAPGQYLSIRCSTDKQNWTACGQVFKELPAWVTKAIPGVGNLWAPDISYFHGLYRVYYAASTLRTQESVIGEVTNVTLDPADPRYRWVDQGEVLSSRTGDDFNAIDPSLLVDTDGRVWMTYGSFYSGIKQREMDPATGMLLASNPVRNELAVRPDSPDDAVEGASLVRHGAFYYLFLSVDHCCALDVSGDDYKEIVGRSSSPNGPFLDAHGTALLEGGGSILLQGNPVWLAPGGGSVYLNPQSGDSLLVFHALNASQAANPTLWMKTVTWPNDWPVLN